MHKAFTAMTTKICKGQERKHREPSVTHMHAHEHTCTSVWRREIHHRSAVQCHEHTCTHVHQDVGTFDSILIEPLRCLSSSLFKPLTFGSLGTVASAESLLLSVFGLRTWLCVCACLNVCVCVDLSETGSLQLRLLTLIMTQRFFHQVTVLHDWRKWHHHDGDTPCYCICAQRPVHVEIR